MHSRRFAPNMFQQYRGQVRVAALLKIHNQEADIADNVNPRELRIEFDAVEWNPDTGPENDVSTRFARIGCVYLGSIRR